jgi:hypothetical protein
VQHSEVIFSGSDQKLPICFPKKVFVGKKSTISDGLVQSTLLAGEI